MPIIRSGYAPTAGNAKHRAYGHHRAHWRRIRAARLTLDGHRCQIRLDGCTGTATSVDLDPRLNGQHDLATLDNTRSACAHCHGKTDGEGGRWAPEKISGGDTHAPTPHLFASVRRSLA